MALVTIEEAMIKVLGVELQSTDFPTVAFYPSVLPQKPNLPAITYQRISTPRVSSMSGPSGLAMPRIQITTYSTRWLEAKGLADVLRGLIDGARDDWDGIDMQRGSIEDERALYDDELKLHYIQLDVVIMHDE